MKNVNNKNNRNLVIFRSFFFFCEDTKVTKLVGDSVTELTMYLDNLN